LFSHWPVVTQERMRLVMTHRSTRKNVTSSDEYNDFLISSEFLSLFCGLVQKWKRLCVLLQELALFRILMDISLSTTNETL
jgi:hypothetical protein